MEIELLNKIYYHDGEISNYERDRNNISFIIKDGWEYDVYYKFELKNINIEVMNNESELICYILDEFNNINKYGNINLFSGDCGKIENSNKYYLKLWIRHPYDFDVKLKVTMNEYKFDGLDINLSNDYDDTGRLYIKFIADEINVEKINKYLLIIR